MKKLGGVSLFILLFAPLSLASPSYSQQAIVGDKSSVDTERVYIQLLREDRDRLEMLVVTQFAELQKLKKELGYAQKILKCPDIPSKPSASE